VFIQNNISNVWQIDGWCASRKETHASYS